MCQPFKYTKTNWVTIFRESLVAWACQHLYWRQTDFWKEEPQSISFHFQLFSFSYSNHKLGSLNTRENCPQSQNKQEVNVNYGNYYIYLIERNSLVWCFLPNRSSNLILQTSQSDLTVFSILNIYQIQISHISKF